MKEFIEYVIKHLVDKPDEVQIKEIAGERTIVFEVRVGDGDLGKVIGRRGQTAGALRTVLAAVAAKQGQRSVLEILEGTSTGQRDSRHENRNREEMAAKHVPESGPEDESRWLRLKRVSFSVAAWLSCAA